MKNIKKNKIDKSEGRLDIVLREIFRLEKKMNIGFDGLHNSFNQLQEAVDGYAKKADTYFQEMVMLAHKVDRLERWILQIAEKVGLRLKP
ncbi:hypothetical protein COY65_01455 [Candidatus Jorgensenbacteria bacterium CG_4_10_14_0_8_um_filter_39_13]|uniref:Uncharacterized protein n=2 Tax=Candidatus Joergenseniibacteriota TaxID=1752739 RepID=A0A2M7RHC5_9BACT|nr:MAG: hypothetical protein COV54_00850 [Candidatus Jorgensenbacteria bacterium CG11_big_fil_rev_8_21_14_0_20_38_23]PIY96149.1 MAG: hypothetical protein COY65_01455 [Candidatus Jorgensenbacteria bacterium CG_4_10_14_0_8_um_filter_39_13]PJA95221.1 MAG: hypothetical protein CO130_00275 [Candidatus Jorgensenbacteria bacterium CG_4_9_14_3_um_filter_38_10]